MNGRLSTIILASIVAIALAVAAACGDDDGGEGTATPALTSTPSPTAGTPTETPAETAAPTPTPTETEEPFSGSRDTVERPDPETPPVATQVDVRYAAHSDFDRVVFDFIDNTPGFVIGYVEPPILADGSGLEVEIDGDAFLQVRFSTARAHDEAGNTTVDELEIMPGLASILEIERTGDFEGYVTWVLGLPEELDFRVYVLEDPIRVVVDVGHP